MARGNLSRENEMCFNHAVPGHRSRPRARIRGHKSLLLQTMTALLHNKFLFMCGKGLNYIDLRFVDRSQGVLTWYPYHTATYYKWPNLCFDRNPNMSPVHPQGGRRPNFGQPVTRPTPGRTERNGTVLGVVFGVGSD